MTKLWLRYDSAMTTIVYKTDDDNDDSDTIEISDEDYRLFIAAEQAYEDWIAKFERMVAAKVVRSTGEERRKFIKDLKRVTTRSRPRGIQQ
jgi:hypothetical protein